MKRKKGIGVLFVIGIMVLIALLISSANSSSVSSPGLPKLPKAHRSSDSGSLINHGQTAENKESIVSNISAPTTATDAAADQNVSPGDINCSCTCSGGSIVKTTVEPITQEANLNQMHPIMSKEVWEQRNKAVKNLPEVGINPGVRAVIYPSSFSLLGYVPYTPKERDQGQCGNCWVWGCTAPIEVANYVQNGISNRLSIQYFDSNYNNGKGSNWACCGGNELLFQNFYSSKGQFVPWSNSNADYHDNSRYCSNGGTSVPASSISTSPNYPITSIKWNRIQTTGVSTAQAISNIKSYLYGNKPVTLGFYLPDFTPFWNYWAADSGNWNPDLYCGKRNGVYPGGHEVTVVGWDDASDSWIVLNSWGADSAHPDGTYKLKMDMNYNCANNGYYSYSFGYFDVAFGKRLPPNTPSTPTGIISGTHGRSYSYSTSATDPNGYQVKYTFDWGDGTKTTTKSVSSGTKLSASHSWGRAGNYEVQAMATNSKGDTSGWSDALSVVMR